MYTIYVNVWNRLKINPFQVCLLAKIVPYVLLGARNSVFERRKKTGIKTSDTQGHEHYPSLTWKIDETQSLNSLSSSLSS